MSPSLPDVGVFEPLADEWLVVIDPQAIFADPATSAWGSPMWAETVPRIRRLVTAYEGRVVVTRFVADPGVGGSWAGYYDDWPFALVPGTGGVFTVRLDDDVLWDRKEQGGFPELSRLKQLVRDHVAPDRSLGHSDNR